MAISEQDLLKRDVLKSHIDSVNQRKLDMGPPSPRGNDYTRPVDEHVARGYFDEANQITPLGEEFLTLHDNGLVDNFGMATELGQSYLMSNREAQDAPVSVYRFREESGLAEAERFAASQDGEQRGFSDMIYDFATKSIPSAVETGYNIAIAPVAETALSVPRKIAELATGVDYKLPRTMSPNDITNAVAENMTGSILASEDIAAGAIYAGTMAMDDPATFGANILDKLPYGLVVRKVAGDPVMDEMVRRKTDESFAAKQAFERSRSEIAELTGAQMMETVAPIFQWAKAREQLVTENGEEAVKSKEENDRLLGSIALDPENVLSLGAGIAIKGATTAVAKTNLWAARTSLKNAALQAERAAVQSEMSAIQAGLTRPSRWISDAELKSKALVDVGDFQGATRYDEFIKRVNLKSEVPLQRISELSATEAKLGDEITQLGSSPDIANAILASKEKAASFRNLTAGGFGLTGVVGDKIGSAMIKADDFLDAASKNMGIDSAVSTLKSLPAAIGGYVMGGVPAGVTAALNVLARGKVVQSMGNFSKVLGSELMQERGSIGYWGRVAQNSTLTKAQRFLAHRADELTLGGSLMDVARPVVAGTVAAYPMNLAFEAVSNPDASGQEILTNAMGPSLVFGGGSAGAGAVLQGRQAHLAQIRMADEYNFTRRMAEQSTEGSQAFSSLVPSAKRMVSTLAATYPNLNWDFSNKTESYYDPVSNTINVNPESNNPLRPLISHEVLHYVTIRNQMEPVVHSVLLGDSETPGLIRNTDGTLDPEFKAFKDVYDARIANANLPPRTIEQVAEEYFNEATVDELLSMVDTGEVSRIAGRTQLGRKVKALIDATIPKITILKDLFNHTGGVRGMDNKPVMGNGLLAEGIRDLPEAKAIMRKLIRDSAGQDPTMATSGDRSGTRIEIKRGDSVIDSFHSIFEVDASGNLITDKNGDPVPLSRATDEARKSAGLIIGEAQRDKVSNGYLPKEGEMKQQDNGSWQGRYIDKSLIDVLAGRGILNPKQIAILRNLSTATKGNQGLRFLLTNHPATIRNRKGKLNYATLEATLRESVPVGFSITKDGNILVHNMSVGQLDANITARAGSKRGIDLYSGNTESIKRDVSEMMELHQKNTATDEFYQNKYGSRWKEYQQFINTVFGLMTKEQQSINPMFQSDSISSQKGQVYRTYRLDRISKATRMDGATSMPFHYENIKMNFLPDGFADATKPADTTRYLPENKIEDGFYSQLESVISKKIPTRATPEQIMATIDPTRGSGIKADEIKWSGIEQALPKLAVDGKVTKEALLKYLADEGNVRFEEVKSDVGTSMGSQDFSVHVLPGGENYREVVLAMPEVSMTQDSSSEFKAFMAEMTRKYPNEDGTFPVWSKMTDSEVNRMEVLEGEANAGKFSQTAKKKKEANYTSSHFPDIPNYVAHMRLDERTLGDGTRTLHSAEYQSDRHQEGRKKGYAGELPTGYTVEPFLYSDGRDSGEWVVRDSEGNFNGAHPTKEAAIRNRIKQLGGVADAPFRTTWPLQLFKRQLRDAVEGGFDSVSWDVGETQNDRFDLSKSLDRVDVFKHGENDYTIDTRLRGGDQGPIEEHISVERVETLLGKDFASKVANQTKTRAEYSGDNLKAGGSGMRGFYDTMLPKEIGKYVKQWNGKVEKSEIKGNAADIDTRAENIFAEWERTGDDYNKTYSDAQEQAYAELGKNGVVESTPIWRVDITPEMRKISETGQTRYLPEGTQIKRFTNELTNTPLEDTFKVESDGPLFRSVTQKDWDRIQDQGYLDSDQRYAVSKNEGVNMASSAESAITYAPIGDNSVLLKINPLGIKLHGYIGDQYIRTWDKIKLDNIEDVGKFIGGETKPSYINEMSASIRYLPEGDKKVKIAEKSDENTEQGTPAPDSDVKDIPLTGNPIPWDRSVSKQTRFLPESNRAAFPTMSPKLLAQIESETSTLAGIHIDRMRVGEYMGVDLQGGMFYPTINENLENGVVWAFNSTGVARTVANRAAQNNGYVKLILMQEGNVVGNKTFANIWFNILSDSVGNNKISLQSALSELNKVRERVYSTLKNKSVKRNPWIQSHSADWTSLKEAREALLSMPQIERGGTYFKKSKTTTVSEGDKISYQALLSQKMTKAGFPNTKEIVNNIEEPALKGIPTGAAVAIIKFDPLSANEKIMTAKEAGVTEHMSYGYVLKGKPIAKLSHYQVVEETFPKTKGQIMTQQHTDFEIRKSIPSKKQARGTIDYGSPTSKNKTLAGQIRKMKE